MNRFLSLVVTVALFSLTGRANAHAFPQNAIPAAGSVLAQAPTEVVITFTEALEPRFSSLQVLDAAGARVDTGTAQTAPSDGRIFSTHVKPLLPGTYKVVWHATSVDTHKTEGSYSFTVEK